MKKARVLSILFVVVLLAVAVLGEAQQPAKKIPRVGFLSLTPATVQKDRIEAFREALRKLGYIDGQNIAVEYRFGDNKSERMSGLAADLVHLNVDVIVTTGSSATRPAKEATTTIPIVMMSDNDPVGSGFVTSLARPGGNITGLTNISKDLGDKRLELLTGGPLMNGHRKRVVEFAAKNKLPAMYNREEFVDAGGLVSYATSIIDLTRRAATFVDKILKGTKPSDIPVEQPTKFELVINLKAAKQISLKIPPNVLARADKVIK